MGLSGWQSSSEAREARSHASFASAAGHYVERLERALLDTRDALELDIARSRVDEDDSGEIDWDALNRRIEHDAVHPELGRAGLAVLRSVETDDAFAGQAVSAHAVSATVRQPAESAPVRLDVVRGGAEDTGSLSIGTDLLAADATRESALDAWHSGHAVLYVADDSSGSGPGSGAWLYAPLYAIASPWSPQDRRSQFLGLAFAPVDLGAIVARVAEDFPELSATVRLGGRFVGGDVPPLPSNAAERRSPVMDVTRRMLGQPFGVVFRATTAHAEATADATSARWLLQSAVATGLLLALGVYRTRTARACERRWSGRLAEHATRIAALERVNADLESFAYVVSHDLRTPLRKLQALTELLADDLAASDEHPVDPEDVGECLRRMREQVSCMDSLVVGIRDYSRASVAGERVETLDTRTRIASVAASIGVPPGSVQMSGEFPTIRTWAVRFDQVMANLIGNAFKYHNRPAEARIEVAVSGFGDYCLFSVRDDGPGIDPGEHERIFEVFESIPVPGVESSGIGLSIVRKAVESVGGRLSLDSVPGTGSVFRFTWPKDIVTGPSPDAADPEGSDVR